MEPTTHSGKLEPGVFQGTPDFLDEKKLSSQNLIRTMKSDMTEAIKNQNETVVSIAIAEEKKKAIARAESEATKTENENPPIAPKRIGRIVVIAIMLLIIASAALIYIFILPKLGSINLPSITLPSFATIDNTDQPKGAQTEPTHTPISESLIPAQSEKRFNVSNQTREKIIAETAIEIANGIPAGSIKNIYFEESSATATKAVSVSRLFNFMKISAPEIFMRSLVKQFMIGFWGEESLTATPFIILKVSDYDTGFAGMLEWEETFPRAFDSFFGTNINAELKSNIKFQDIVVLERDARVVETPSGDTIAYVFANENTIVIVGSQNALEALIPLAGKK